MPKFPKSGDILAHMNDCCASMHHVLTLHFAFLSLSPTARDAPRGSLAWQTAPLGFWGFHLSFYLYFFYFRQIHIRLPFT